MWDQMVYWMGEATFWDWFWHIVAIAITLYLSVPGLWWPQFEKYVLKKKKGEDQEAQSSNHLPIKPKS